MRSQSARLQHKIGIANKKQLAGGSPSAVVHTAPEAQVPASVQHLHVWIRCREVLERVVGRSVVHDHDDTDTFALQTRDALAERLPGVVVHDDSSNLMGRWFGFQPCAVHHVGAARSINALLHPFENRR
jgi:hypothetical protein